MHCSKSLSAPHHEEGHRNVQENEGIVTLKRACFRGKTRPRVIYVIFYFVLVLLIGKL